MITTHNKNGMATTKHSSVLLVAQAMKQTHHKVFVLTSKSWEISLQYVKTQCTQRKGSGQANYINYIIVNMKS